MHPQIPCNYRNQTTQVVHIILILQGIAQRRANCSLQRGKIAHNAGGNLGNPFAYPGFQRLSCVNFPCSNTFWVCREECASLGGSKEGLSKL